jgi:hypothetical protein
MNTAPKQTHSEDIMTIQRLKTTIGRFNLCQKGFGPILTAEAETKKGGLL